jgi:flagellar biosynthesis/type III secretory pathway protein FliH
MSSSDGATPAPWALDELDMSDVFMPLHDFGSGVSDAPPAPGVSVAPSAAEEELESRVAARLVALRPAIEAEAFARGHAVGVQAAGAAAHEQVARIAQALGEATQAVQTHEQRWLGNVEENLAAIAVTVARHLIHRELTADASVVTSLVTRALKQFPLERTISVRLHPDDHAIVQEALEASTLTVPTSHEVHWHADPHIVRGGCLVEGRERVLDGRIDTALERAYRALGQVQA